jgi:DNA polymerase I
MRKRFILDLESDSLLPDVTKIHCIVLYDLDAKEFLEFRPNEIDDAIAVVAQANKLYGIPVIEKLYPQVEIKAELRDTLIVSQLVYTNLAEKDKASLFPGHNQLRNKGLRGSHSLKAWGYRLGHLKGDYGEKQDAWSHYSEEMLRYCRQDVFVTLQLAKHLSRIGVDPRAIAIESDFARLIQKQTQHGFAFNVKAAERLEHELMAVKADVTDRLRKQFDDFTDEEVFTPKVNNTKRGYIAGVATVKRKTVTFNPGSRLHAARALKEKYDYEYPLTLGKNKHTGKKELQLQVTEATLKKLPFPEKDDFLLHNKVTKILGLLSSSPSAWLRLVQNERIHGRVKTAGAVTGRCTHSSPNITQTPKVKVDKETKQLVFGREGKWGADCRSLFTASPGMVLVGADASGLELRCLAHYMGKFDGGAYAKVILEGDIHTVNQEAAGLDTRDQAKTFIYGFLYGAGDEKIGAIVGKNAQAGRILREKFLKGLPALGKLITQIQSRIEKRKNLPGLDGRILNIRSAHSALNMLLQSAGAIIMKRALIEFHKLAAEAGYSLDRDYHLVANIHDEIQLECYPESAEVLGKLLVRGMQLAGEYFNFRCPIDGEYKIGNNWAETH